MISAAFHRIEFQFNHAGDLIKGDQMLVEGAIGHVLAIHGGGTSSARSFDPLRDHLTKRGISSTAFSFPGHGHSSGEVLGSTLKDRVEITKRICDEFNLKQQEVSIFGFSMGAYVAICVASDVGARKLCLVVPAMYHPAAFEKPFGPDFSMILRQENSWRASDGIKRIGSFIGDLLIVAAGDDQVIPADLPPLLASSAGRARAVRLITVVNAGHNLADHYAVFPETRTQVFEEMVGLVENRLIPGRWAV